MFRSLANFFRGDDWPDGIVARFDEMLELAEQNFRLCADQLVEGSEIDVVAHLTSRTFAGLETLQLEIRDVAPAGQLRTLVAGPEGRS